MFPCQIYLIVLGTLKSNKRDNPTEIS